MNIDKLIDDVIRREGGYVDHPADRGGKTIWGITEAVARANGYTGLMKAMPRATAVAIYRSEYAIKPGFAAVAEVYPDLGAKLFDVGVNMGPAWPSRWLQEWLNALNQGGKLGADLVEDGKLGAKTLAALKALKAWRGAEGEQRLLTAIRGDQTARYKAIVRGSASQRAFAYGWLARAAA
ncbi:glycoside hydrolase family 108 protein [Sphingobium sp. CFD-1]|uniref:glycoside hydrolase family 108 protein n=1 Tax=Sphingobium sp. CFD-1 TaxID=2878545 RepID=UPI00214B5B74|nr:glycosyl hydrolase 108 family protein [Sphingobium sp. CFD-1]